MTVFIAHAESDRAVAEALEKFLERRGLFVELENGEREFRALQANDTVVALWSKDTVGSKQRLPLEKRALQAWADEQLIVVKLDRAFAPVGLRDLKAIDAGIEQQRDIAWAAVAKKAGEPQPARADAASQAPASAAQRKAAPQASSGGSPLAIIFVPLALLLIGGGLYAFANGGRDFLTNGLPPKAYKAFLPVAVTTIAVALLAFMYFAMRARRAAAPGVAHDPLFVSYAHADNMAVVPVVEAVQAQGRTVWIDKGELHAGTSWAGEIVRAIKNAKGVIVMCSAHAFESDHVKREVYLADRYKKPILPVFLEAATMPEDFEYFFTGVQWLELHKTPENERAAAIARALKTV